MLKFWVLFVAGFRLEPVVGVLLPFVEPEPYLEWAAVLFVGHMNRPKGCKLQFPGMSTLFFRSATKLFARFNAFPRITKYIISLRS